MRDACVWYEVCRSNDGYIVNIDGKGDLRFNLRDFNTETYTDDISYHVVVKGTFNTDSGVKRLKHIF